jgi:aromatic-L-amino-acid decarboxylase
LYKGYFDYAGDFTRDVFNNVCQFYCSGEGHGCHQKAIELMGVGSEALRTVEQDRSLRMVGSALDDAIRKDRQLGDFPIAVIGSAGTVNTGATVLG